MAGAPFGNDNRHKGRIWRDAILEAMDQRAKSDRKEALRRVADKLVAAAMEGDVTALKEIGDRVEGKSLQAVEHSGPDGGAIPFATVERRVVDPKEETT